MLKVSIAKNHSIPTFLAPAWPHKLCHTHLILSISTIIFLFFFFIRYFLLQAFIIITSGLTLKESKPKPAIATLRFKIGLRRRGSYGFQDKPTIFTMRPNSDLSHRSQGRWKGAGATTSLVQSFRLRIFISYHYQWSVVTP
ncbi:hypothetical protein V8G54_029787 [Vigna mungo]|uniref:Uncharacterized protein n=1 Tax=Vigna mungo TaxID=3915 RepID=A0AAQ3MUX7_VIGMU